MPMVGGAYLEIPTVSVPAPTPKVDLPHQKLIDSVAKLGANVLSGPVGNGLLFKVCRSTGFWNMTSILDLDSLSSHGLRRNWFRTIYSASVLT